VHRPSLSRTAPIVALLCVAMPAGALAKGGGGGGTTSPPSSAPCVKLVPTNTGKKFNRNAIVDARFGVSNCGSSSITVTTGATSVSTPYSVTPTEVAPVPCAGPSASGGSLTLKPGEQRSVEFSLPPSGCPMGPYGALLRVDATAQNASATVLATAQAWYQITLENL
jgi:hypothetical protein